jgi:hypothetical protein
MMTLGITYDEKLQRRIRIDTQGGGTLYTSLVSAMETEELYQGVQYSALIVDEIILNVVVTTRSVVGTMDGHLIIIFQEWKNKKLRDGILKVASNLMTILRSEGWAVSDDYDTRSIGGPMEYSINPGLAVDVTGADSRLNQDNYLDVIDDITGVNPPIIMVDELDGGVVQLDLVGSDAIEQQYVVVTTECIIVVGTTETVQGKKEAHSNDKFSNEVSVVSRRIYRRYTVMSRDGYSIIITYPSRDGMLWDSGHATAETDRETCTVLDDIGESSDNELEGDADADLENQVIPVMDEVRAQVELLGANEPRQLTWYNRHGDVIDDGPAWDAGHTTAEADCETQSVLHEIDDATVREEQDVESQEWDPEQQVQDLDVVDDIAGVDPHIEDVVESLDEYHDIEVENGDVNEQIDEVRGDSAQEDSDEDSAQGDSDVNFSQEDSRGGSQRLVQPLSTMNQESTQVESGQSLRRMCIQPSRLIPSFKKIDDLSDEERGSNFQAGIAALQPASPKSSQVTEMIDKLSGREELHLRSVDLLDDTYNHNLNSYGYIAECISKAERKLKMSGNVGGMGCTKEAEVPGLYP